MKTWKSGLLWFVPHAMGWALMIWLPDYLMNALGWPYLVALLLRIGLMFIVCGVTGLAEHQETEIGKQTKGKMYIDLVAKCGGTVAATFTAGWWREYL